MKVRIQKAWHYTLWEDDSKNFFIGILCGSVGLYEIVLQLTDQEKRDYRERGEAFLEELASAVQLDPFAYQERHIRNWKL